MWFSVSPERSAESQVPFLVLPFGCVPVVRYAPCPMFARLDRQTTLCSPLLLSSSCSYAQPGLGTTSCWMHQAPKWLLSCCCGTRRKAWQTEQLLAGLKQGKVISPNEIYCCYLLKHYLAPRLLDHSGSAAVHFSYIGRWFEEKKKRSKKAKSLIIKIFEFSEYYPNGPVNITANMSAALWMCQMTVTVSPFCSITTLL